MKKSKIEAAIETEGLESVASNIASSIVSDLTNRELLYRYVLVELKGATLGNEVACDFARQSGIGPNEYEDALEESHPAIDGPRGIKTMLDTASLSLVNNRDLMVAFRLAVIDKVMQYEKIGKYCPTLQDIASTELSDVVNRTSGSEWGAFRDLLNDIQASGTIIVKEPLLSAAAGYAMELAISGLFVSGFVRHGIIGDKKEGIMMFKSDIGEDLGLHGLAVDQAVDLAGHYIPGINGNHLAGIILAANSGVSFREEGGPPPEPHEVLLYADKYFQANT